jgi:hypothetical protein
LLSAQNSFLGAWVDYDVQRMNLDFQLGTMQLDAMGNWVDPGPVKSDRTASRTELPSGSLPGPPFEELPVPAPQPPELESIAP